MRKQRLESAFLCLLLLICGRNAAAAQVTPDFSVSIEPATVTVAPGNEANFTITLTSAGNFEAPVEVRLIGVSPQALNFSYTAPNAVTPRPGLPASVAFTIQVRDDIEAAYVLTFRAVGGGLTHDATAAVRYERIRDSFILRPSVSSLVLPAGPAPGSAEVLLTVEPGGGYRSYVDLTILETGPFAVSLEKTRLAPWETIRVTISKYPGIVTPTGRFGTRIRGTGGGVGFDVDIGVQFVPDFDYASGDRRVLFVPVRMRNAPQVTNLESIQPDIDRMIGFYREVSYGRLRLQADVLNKWYDLPGTHEEYFVVGNRPVTEDSLDAIDGDVDLRNYNLYVFLLEGSDSAFAGGYRVTSTGDGDIEFAAAHVPAQLPGLIVHELGHTFYLPDLYDLNRKEFFFTYWDEMGEGAAHFSGWARRKLGWLPDEQIEEVMPGESRTLTLSPIELSGAGTKLIRIPRVSLAETNRPATPPFLPSFSPSKYLYLEARKRIGYDSDIPSDGVLLYAVDETIPSGLGPLRIVDATPLTPTLADAAFSPLTGDRSVFEDSAAGLRISVEHRETDLYVLNIEYLPPGRATLNVDLGSQGAATATTAAAAGATQAGYLEASLDSGRAPYAVAVISYEQNGVVVSEVGVPVSLPTNSARVFVDYRNAVAVPGSAGTVGVSTGFAAINRGGADATLIVTLRDLNGAVLSSGAGLLKKGTHVARFVEQLGEIFTGFSVPGSFPEATGFGTLEISSNEPVSLTALRLTVNQRGEALLTTTPVADGDQAPSTWTLLFPQFADGGGYTTSVLLINTSSQVQSGTLEWFNGNGVPLDVRLTDGSSGASRAYTIPAGGARIFQTDSGGAVARTGWIRLTPAGGTSTPAGIGLFEYSRDGVLITQTGIPSTAGTIRSRIYADLSGGHDTGLALANPGASAVEVVLGAFDRFGAPLLTVAPRTITLPPSGHSSQFLRQYLAGLPDGFQGVIEITSDAPVAALTVRSLINTRGDFLITSFPVADMTKTPPAPLIFPQIADRGGYRTEVILLSPGPPASLRLQFRDDGGNPLPVGAR